MIPISIKRGAAFTAVLDDLSGNAGAAVVSASLKYGRDGSAPGDDAAAVAVFSVTFQADIDRGDGTAGPGWFLVLNENDTETLIAGRTVLTDVRIEIDGAVHYTPTQRLTVVERVTEDANG